MNNSGLKLLLYSITKRGNSCLSKTSCKL